MSPYSHPLVSPITYLTPERDHFNSSGYPDYPCVSDDLESQYILSDETGRQYSINTFLPWSPYSWD